MMQQANEIYTQKGAQSQLHQEYFQPLQVTGTHAAQPVIFRRAQHEF